MKKTIVNTILTTGISIIGLTLYFAFTNKNTVLINTILELFGANIVIHIGLYIREKIEIRNMIIEHIIDISYVLIVGVAFGIMFKWFFAVPVWLFIISGVNIYLVTYILTISKVKKDTKEINELLEKSQE